MCMKIGLKTFKALERCVRIMLDVEGKESAIRIRNQKFVVFSKLEFYLILFKITFISVLSPKMSTGQLGSLPDVYTKGIA